MPFASTRRRCATSSRGPTASSSSPSAGPSARRTTPTWSTSGGVTLQEDDVAPHAVALAEALVSTDDAEAQRLVQREAGDVLRKDSGEKRPVAVGLRARDQLAEQRSTDALAARGCGDVHALFCDAAIAAPVRIRR